MRRSRDIPVQDPAKGAPNRLLTTAIFDQLAIYANGHEAVDGCSL